MGAGLGDGVAMHRSVVHQHVQVRKAAARRMPGLPRESRRSSPSRGRNVSERGDGQTERCVAGEQANGADSLLAAWPAVPATCCATAAAHLHVRPSSRPCNNPSEGDARRVRRDDDARRGGDCQSGKVCAVEGHDGVGSRMLRSHEVQSIEDHSGEEAAIRAPLQRLVVYGRLELVELEDPCTRRTTRMACCGLRRDGTGRRVSTDQISARACHVSRPVIRCSITASIQTMARP